MYLQVINILILGIEVNNHRPCRWLWECGKTSDNVLRLA